MRFLLIFLLLLLGGGVAISYWLDGEKVEEVYPSYRSAVRAGSIERGWLPHFLPPSATDIREVHDLDTNEGWTTFSFDESGRRQLEGNLLRVGGAPEWPGVRRPDTWWRRFSWWPSVFDQPLTAADLAKKELAAYTIRDISGGIVSYSTVAVNWRDRKAYLYHTGR